MTLNKLMEISIVRKKTALQPSQLYFSPTLKIGIAIQKIIIGSVPSQPKVHVGWALCGEYYI